jgi:hypothetical protein
VLDPRPAKARRGRTASPLLIAVFGLVAAFGVVACDSAATLAPAPGSSASAAASAGTGPTPKPTKAAKTPVPTDEATPEETMPAEETSTPEETPEATPEETPEGTPSEEPSATPEASPTASPSAGPAAACSGTANNRDFYATLASSVTWDVYCAVLPSGWHVSTGSYSQRSGGRLTIAYKGPGGATLELKEGAWCAGASDCPPAGGTPGGASFGGMSARLTDLGGAHFAVIAGDANVAWQASATGLDADTLTALTAAFALVGP